MSAPLSFSTIQRIWSFCSSLPFDMIDPVSIVGLTIAIFDQLLKLGERTAELTSDIRAFSDVS